MKIAILSFSFLTLEHVGRLRKLGEVVEHQSTNNEADAISRLQGAEVAIADCWDVPLNKEVFESSPSLKYVSLNSTGYNQVDLIAAKEHGVSIANVPGFSTDGVAEQAIGLMFATLRHIPMSDREMRKKPFQIDPANRTQDIYLGANIHEKTLGIIGLGQIGMRVAEMGKGLGMKVIAYNRTQKHIEGVEMVDLDTVLKTSDVISLNAAFVEEMRNLIDKSAIEKMKPSAILVNTARGDFVDEGALAKALSEKRIAGYGTDVLADWTTDNPLLALDNVTLTPHSGFFTVESLKNMADSIVANVESYAAGKPQNIVNL